MSNSERASIFVEAAIILPVVIFLVIGCFDLGRVWLTLMTEYEVVGQISKLGPAVSLNQIATDESNLVKFTAGEDPVISQDRAQFWQDEKDSLSSRYHGKPSFTQRELRVFNLAYGTLTGLNSNINFPIAYHQIDAMVSSSLQISCSIFFRFAGPALPSPIPTPPNSALLTPRDRIYTIECIVPLLSGRLLGPVFGQRYFIPRKTVYAYQSGGLA